MTSNYHQLANYIGEGTDKAKEGTMQKEYAIPQNTTRNPFIYTPNQYTE
jgi:hypothetical protein